MNNYLPEGSQKLIESRNIEFRSGELRNCFYSDGLKFLIHCIKNRERFDFFICSNAHTAHIKGILKGADMLDKLRQEQIIGWDTTKSLKNTRTKN